MSLKIPNTHGRDFADIFAVLEFLEQFLHDEFSVEELLSRPFPLVVGFQVCHFDKDLQAHSRRLGVFSNIILSFGTQRHFTQTKAIQFETLTKYTCPPGLEANMLRFNCCPFSI